MDPLRDLFDRIPPLVEGAVDGLTADRLATPPADGANTITWLVWHLTRVEDDHLAEVAGHAQVWLEDQATTSWPERFGLPAGTMDTGYGHAPDEVLAVRAEADTLIAYHDAVAARTTAFLDGIGGDDLDRVVDERWDPPVTLGARLVSVASDALQHLGQAHYVRGLLTG
jgi:hypothetical protein